MPSFFPSFTRRRTSSRSNENLLPPPYAIEFTQAGSEGERIATKKHHVQWRFAFADAADSDDDSTLVDNNEIATTESTTPTHHEIVLLWDWNARRRFIYMDGKEVNREISRASACDVSWEMMGNNGRRHEFRVVAYAFAKNNDSSSNRDFRQYDLLVDGRSFFSVPKR
mmetsp:Transcript_36613/g.76827  ORF Transcript_36613/g.76827 Transcript_36613/m.76827 type:complete len:168 (-) Transcript_36613:252-755(-)